MGKQVSPLEEAIEIRMVFPRDYFFRGFYQRTKGHLAKTLHAFFDRTTRYSDPARCEYVNNSLKRAFN